ncbi:hypothetical protein HNR62_000341 [Oceanisphaera litoralis]|uniref:RecB family exonuclease n=1 Tax=Oceanisphaera litoralis TaxID=225144 RepID=UPI00195DA608|nr:PD-(D/E)XK nuclease family protein [Oceanisphaera litoralis]MBM7454512.1 hypothetical protein [Oceanisphaera litoralis]
MSFKDALKSRAAESGHVTIQMEQKPAAEKAETKTAFTGALQARKVDTAKKEDPTQISTTFETGAVPVWSFSTLKDYEACPYRVYLAKIEKKPQKDSDAASRGTAMHDMAENWVRVGGELPAELSKFTAKFEWLREQFIDGKVQMEENWGIRKDWSPCEWNDPELWGRGKLDVFVRESETSALIIDHKSGRKYGNELKHSDQGISYALHAFHRYPELEHFSINFWYLDKGEEMPRSFTRRQLGVLLPRYHKRAMELTTAQNFLPKPNASNCNWCAYGNGKFGTGDCPYAS